MTSLTHSHFDVTSVLCDEIITYFSFIVTMCTFNLMILARHIPIVNDA